jgi:hypothetical protein
MIMGHDTLNKTISIPDLPRNPYAWGIPSADMLYNDHLVDPLEDEMLREDWLGDEVNSNPLMSEEKDVKESRYGAKLGGLAVGLDKEVSDEDEDQYVEPSDDEAEHEEIEGANGRS